MRPGRLTPENQHDCELGRMISSRFNEAGAINPGKPNRVNWCDDTKCGLQ